MTQGRFIAIVGPSGVGKDSVMAGIHQAMPHVHLVRRVITRAPGQGGEDYDAVSTARFDEMADAGAFALHWSAHGLRYGIPLAVNDHLNRGTDCLANLSRTVLPDAARRFRSLVVLNIFARPETIAQRLAARGRETREGIEQRLAEANKPLPEGPDTIHLSNDGPLSRTVAQATALLQPVGVPE